MTHAPIPLHPDDLDTVLRHMLEVEFGDDPPELDGEDGERWQNVAHLACEGEGVDGAVSIEAWRAARGMARVLAERRAAAEAGGVAREFFRRFGPIRVLLGKHGECVAYAEGDDDGGDWLSGMSFGDTQNVAHAASEDGFVAALERARQLVHEGGR